MLVAVVLAAVVGLPHLLPELALGGEGQERGHGGARVGDGVLALLATLRGGGGGGGAQRFREAPELRLVDEHHVALLVREDVVGELGVEPRELLLILRVACLRLALELRAGAANPS